MVKHTKIESITASLQMKLWLTWCLAYSPFRYANTVAYAGSQAHRSRFFWVILLLSGEPTLFTRINLSLYYSRVLFGFPVLVRPFMPSRYTMIGHLLIPFGNTIVIDIVERVAYVLCWNWTRDFVRPGWCGPQRGLNIAGWTLTMSTNCVATSMIAYKAW